MANIAYLLNVMSESDIPDVLDRSGGSARPCIEIMGPGYRIPIPWLCSFGPQAMRTFDIPNGDDVDGTPLRYTARVCVTSRADAIGRLQAALPLFERLTGETRLARSYWSRAVAGLQALPYDFVVLDPSEILDLRNEEEGPRELALAMGGEPSAIDYLKDWSDYESGALPYPGDVHRCVVYGLDDARNNSTIALDAAFNVAWRYPGGGADADYMALDIAPDPDWNALDGLLDELCKLLRAHVAKARAYYGLVPLGRSPLERLKRLWTPAAPQGLKLLISAPSDEDVAALAAAPEVRAQLAGADSRMGAQLQVICERYGYQWQGVVFLSSPAWRAMGDDHVHWMKLAATLSYIPR